MPDRPYDTPDREPREQILTAESLREIIERRDATKPRNTEAEKSLLARVEDGQWLAVNTHNFCASVDAHDDLYPAYDLNLKVLFFVPRGNHEALCSTLYRVATGAPVGMSDVQADAWLSEGCGWYISSQRPDVVLGQPRFGAMGEPWEITAYRKFLHHLKPRGV